jgi:hypothetical protein
MGFDNIASNSGWSQAFLGGTIVMIGLIVLSFAISQIHKLVDLWENRSRKVEAAPAPAVSDNATTVDGITLNVPLQCPADISLTAALYMPIVVPLGPKFELKDLYRRAAEFDLPHPHLTIRCLREAGILMPVGEGFFRWNS